MPSTKPRIKLSSYIDEWQEQGLDFVTDRDGILRSEQIRRAITAWLKSKGVVAPQAEKRRAVTRRSS